MSAAVNILLRRPPGPDSDFVEVETDDGHSISVGEWTHRPNGLWALRITPNNLHALDSRGRRRWRWPWERSPC